MRFSQRARAALVWVCLGLATAVRAEPFDWTPAQEDAVVEILTSDADGDLRETPVWIVVVDGAAFVRTGDSKWLANIRRGSLVRLRMRGDERAVEAREITDTAVAARIEQAFQAKYGLVQQVMSFFRVTEPTVLRLTALTW
jgi:hypothetical protein